MKGYTGPDHIGTIDALRQIAEARYPEHWTNVPEDELAIWNGLGVNLAADLWEQHLFVQLRDPDPLMVHRLIDYREAVDQLRDALISEQLVAFVAEDDGSLQKVFAHTWRTAEAVIALYRGSAWLDYGEDAICRLLLLPRSAVGALITGMAAAACAVASAPKKARSGRPPKHDPAYVRSIVFRLMDDNGDFNVAVEIWNVQARLEEAVRAELGSDLAEGSLRAAITPHLAEWRASKARNAKA